MGWGLCVSSPEKGRGGLLSSDLCSQRWGCFRKAFYVEHTALLLGKVNSPRVGAAPAQEVAEAAAWPSRAPFLHTHTGDRARADRVCPASSLMEQDPAWPRGAWSCSGPYASKRPSLSSLLLQAVYSTAMAPWVDSLALGAGPGTSGALLTPILGYSPPAVPSSLWLLSVTQASAQGGLLCLSWLCIYASKVGSWNLAYKPLQVGETEVGWGRWGRVGPTAGLWAAALADCTFSFMQDL